MTSDSAMDEIDRRSDPFGESREALADVARTWPVAPGTPRDVGGLLLEARQQFVGGAVTYGCFAVAALKSLQAAERALAHRLGVPLRRLTLGQLLAHERDHPVLDEPCREWYTRFALHFRNQLAHPKHTVAFTPGLAAAFLSAAHEQVASLFAEGAQERE